MCISWHAQWRQWWFTLCGNAGKSYANPGIQSGATACAYPGMHSGATGGSLSVAMRVNHMQILVYRVAPLHVHILACTVHGATGGSLSVGMRVNHSSLLSIPLFETQVCLKGQSHEKVD
jgi:hypothetical protein